MIQAQRRRVRGVVTAMAGFLWLALWFAGMILTVGFVVLGR